MSPLPGDQFTKVLKIPIQDIQSAFKPLILDSQFTSQSCGEQVIAKERVARHDLPIAQNVFLLCQT